MATRQSDTGEFEDVALEFGGVTGALNHMGVPTTPAVPDKRFSQRKAIAAVSAAVEEPQWGPVRAANALRTRGLNVSPGDVQHIWQHYQLDGVAQRRAVRRRTYRTHRAIVSARKARRFVHGLGPAAHIALGMIAAALLCYIGLLFWG